MKLLIFLASFILLQKLHAQSDETRNKETLIVETEGVVLQGNVDLNTNPELYVGQTYSFTILCSNHEWDLKIESENVSVKLNEKSKKSTGGLNFEVTPLDTGKCNLILYITNEKNKQVCLLSTYYHASTYPIPPVYIGKIRSGEIIDSLKEKTELTCKYDGGSGIFETYPILSWSADINNKKFSGTGNVLNNDLISEINNSGSNIALKLTVNLDKNKTGYEVSEAIFLIK